MQNECRGNNCRTDTVKHDLMEIIMFWDETQKHCADREDWRRCVVLDASWTKDQRLV